MLLNCLGGYGTVVLGWDERLPFYFAFFWIGMCIFSVVKIVGLDIEKFNFKMLIVSMLISLMMLWGSQGKTIRLDLVVGIFCVFEMIIIIEVAKCISNIGTVMKIFSLISYGSVCAYLYHRIIYMLFEKIFGEFSWGFGVGAVLPVTIVLSILIQKLYDVTVKVVRI